MAILHPKSRPDNRVTELLVGPNGAVTMRLTAPAVDGKANTALLTYLAVVLGVAKSRVSLRAGHTSPYKKVELADVSDEQLREVLARFQGENVG